MIAALFALLIVAAVPIATFAASALGLITPTIAARVLVGTALICIAVLDTAIDIRIYSDDGLGSALLVQVPTAVLMAAFLGAVRPTGSLLAIQSLSFILLLFIGLIAIFSFGILYWIADMYLFLGILYTAAAAAQNDGRSGGYWRDRLTHA